MFFMLSLDSIFVSHSMAKTQEEHSEIPGRSFDGSPTPVRNDFGGGAARPELSQFGL